jgi:hypothetical protein
LASVSAASVVAASGGTAISADTVGGTYTTLTGPSLSEATAGELTAGGSITLTAPAGFIFDAGAVVTVTTSGAGCDIALTGVVMTTTTATVTINGASTAKCTLTFHNLAARPTSGTLPATGNITNTGNRGPGGATNYGTLTEVAGAPADVSFTTQPSGSATGGTPFAQQPKVHVEDQFGNPVNNATVSLTKTPSTGATNGVLTCTANSLSTNASGDAQFAGCRFDVFANGYKIRATSFTASEDSTPVNVAVGPADHLMFSSYPAASTLTVLNPQPAVSVVDAGGNVLTNDTRAITIGINQNAGSFTCTGGLTKNAVSGVATFTGCTETVAGTGYKLTATSNPATPNAVSPAAADFTITSGPATKLAICWGAALPCNTTPPATIQGGTVFATQPVVRVEDANGNTVTSDDTTQVSLGILSGTPTSGGPGTLTCTSTTVTVVDGVGTFAGCKIDKAGTGYRLNATSTPTLTAGQSTAFNVVVGPPAKIGFVNAPTSASAGTAITPAITVAIQDAGGNTVTAGYTATIALSLGVNPVSATLVCGNNNTATTVAGVATFSNCVISSQGTGFTLVATPIAVAPSVALGTAQTAPFNVLAPLAAITITPSSSVITWGDDVQLNVHFGTNGAGKHFAIQVSKDNATWSTISAASNLVTDAAGNASFVYGPSDNRYYRVFFAGTPDLQAATSTSVRVVVRQISIIRPVPTSTYKPIRSGTTITFTATIRPNRPELPQGIANFKVFQLKSGEGWVEVLNRMVPVNRANGVATLQVTFNTQGRYYVRSQAVPTPLNANSVWSGLARYDVR